MGLAFRRFEFAATEVDPSRFVDRVDLGEGEIQATVQGTHPYEISIELTDEHIHTTYSCPYDYAGDCKHIVATLLATAERNDEPGNESGVAGMAPQRMVDIEDLIAETHAEDLRRFLREALAADRHLRERFVAFAGEESAKTVQDYKADVIREFEAARDRHGFVDDRTWIEFSQYHDLAETHRERGRVDAATAVYRAIAEAIHENLDRIDDSSGHYGEEIARALTGYAETILEADLEHDRKRPHMGYLCRAFLEDEYGFPGDQYEEALFTICTDRQDFAYWRDRLEAAVPALSPDGHDKPHRLNDDAGSDAAAPSDAASGGDHDLSDTVLFASDFSHGPLTVEDFVGEALDIEHLAVGPLGVSDFAGKAFEAFVVDEPTTLEAHTITGSNRTGSTADRGSSRHIRHVLSTYVAVLEELDADAAIMALLERGHTWRVPASVGSTRGGYARTASPSGH